MKRIIKNNKQYLNIMLIIILYLFSFVLTKQIVNQNVQKDFGDTYVLPIYAICIIFTSLGYCSFYLFNRKNNDYKKNNFIVGLVLLPSALINILTSNTILSISFYIISSVCYGYIGSYICYFYCNRFKSVNNRGMVLGISISSAVLLQILLSYITKNVFVLFIIMYICLIVCFFLCGIEEKKQFLIEPCDRVKLSKQNIILAICVIVLLSIIVGIQDGLAVRFDAFGQIKIYSILKLSYVFGSIASGLLFDYKEGKFYGLTTICVAFATIISLFFIKNPNSFNYNIWCLYYCTGYYIVYSIMRFVEIACNADKPKLWAGMGRLIGCLTIGVTIIPANYLYDKFGVDFIIAFSLVLMIPALILFYLDMNIVFKEDQNKNIIMNKNYDIDAFMNKYSFTEKEKQVFKLLLDKQLQIKEMAFELNISSRSVQRHLTSIYNKTKTNTKIEVSNLFFNQKQN